MRIGIYSDVHTECYTDGGWPEFFKHVPYDKMDLLVLAGDILECRSLRIFLLVFERICEKTKVVYVPGNHEFWSTGRPQERVWEEVIYPGEERLADRLFVLRTGKTVAIDGQVFFGDTMWFPDTPDTRTRMSGWPESRHVAGYVPWVFEQNERWNRSVKSEMPEGCVVVTHHTPSTLSTPEQFRDHGLNCYYQHPAMENVILQKNPKLWLHGHTHTAFDYKIGDTRIVCNPYGLPTQHDHGFNWDKIIEI
jgi:predicted phosphodiesterase